MGEKHKILVIDDDVDMQRLLNKRLRAEGYEVVFAADGVGSLTAVRRQEPDLVLLDLGLPGGDGFKVLERLQKNVELSTIPVLVYSGQNAMMVKDRALKGGASAFVAKTSEKEELLGTIQRLLAS